jgi:glyoxylase-like metal-dependent hydrolase (beta-lactamase superfamily II)
MKIRLLGSSVVGGDETQYLTSYLVDGIASIDAGSLGIALSVEDQARVRRVFLTHSHLDHVASLPIFVENAYRPDRECVVIHGSERVLDSLRRDLFNNRVWPDLFELGSPEAPFLAVEEMNDGESVTTDGLRVTAMSVEHIVPSQGYVVEREGARVLIVSDTASTPAIRERARELGRLDAVFLPVALPDSMKDLARIAKHLTPSDVPGFIAGIGGPARIFAAHLKSKFRDRIVEELNALGIDALEIAKPGREYAFGESGD